MIPNIIAPSWQPWELVVMAGGLLVGGASFAGPT